MIVRMRATSERVREWWSRVGGIVVTVLALVLVELISRRESPFISQGTAIVPALLAVVYAGFLGGLRSALVSAGLVVAFSFYYLSTPGALFTYDETNFRRLVTFTIVIPLVALLVGGLKMRSERAAQRAIEREREFAAALAHKNDELAAAVEGMERANRELSEANETLEAFTYVVSHDLKEPVRAIEAFARAIEEDHADGLPPDALDLAKRTRETSERLTRLLAGLLDYSRASRVLPTDLEPLRVEEMLFHTDCTTRYRNLLDERNARLIVTPGPAIRAAIGPLCMALGNLVLNAVRHNPGPNVLVRVASRTWREDPRLVELTVEDNGPGFPEAVRDRFARTRRGRPQTIRGGFGLIIAREAVEKMDGHLWLDNSPEGGGSVHVLLPGAAPLDEAPEWNVETSRPSDKPENHH